MDIKYLKINGLFNKYNIELDLDRKLNILLGANGTGKSTVLKILDALQKKDFVTLSSFVFQSISITIENYHGKEEMNFNREDFFPTIDKLEDLYERYFKSNAEFDHYNEFIPDWSDKEQFCSVVLNTMSFVFENMYET